MFLGHFAAALFGSRQEPRLRLGTAFLAAQLPDVLWRCFLLAGIERASIVPGDTVVTPLRSRSHWLLDFVAHRPDMPLVPGGARCSASRCGIRFRDLFAAQRDSGVGGSRTS